MKKTISKLALAGLSVVMLLAATSIGSAETKAKAPGPCDGDITQFCSAVKGHSSKKVNACLKEHKADLSQACKDAHHMK